MAFGLYVFFIIIALFLKDYARQICLSFPSCAAGSDFFPINEMFVLNSETTTVSFAVTIIDDEVPEEAESFTFGVIPPQIEGLGVLLPEQAVVVIEDDDQLRGNVL